MSLQFTFDVSPDEHGVYDGRELARLFISGAFQLIVPYAHGCPGCADALFSSLANEVMGELHQHGRQEGRLPSAIYAIGPAEDRHRRQREHLAAASAGTAALLRAQPGREPHEDEEAAPSWEGLAHEDDFEGEIPF